MIATVHRVESYTDKMTCIIRNGHQLAIDNIVYTHDEAKVVVSCTRCIFNAMEVWPR